MLLFALPAWGADCPDNDSDGYVDDSQTCDLAGRPGGDCDDGDDTVYPGAQERCSGKDENCNGTNNELINPDPVDDVNNDGDSVVVDGKSFELIDEGFGPCTFASSGPGGVCTTGGGLVCQWPPGAVTQIDPPGAGALGTFTCSRLQELVTWADEILAANNCADGVDNDCDDYYDALDSGCHTSDESGLCDGVDNDGDGKIDEDFDVGTACTVGRGACRRFGTIQCVDTATAACNAEVVAPGDEGISFGGTCSDGIDNDCDGATDALDTDATSQCQLDGVPSCATHPLLGTACTLGLGACARTGNFACTGATLYCDATPGPAAEEAGNCADGIDNDCDGLVDTFDIDCSAEADLGVTCSLPYRTQRRPGDCAASHTIRFDQGQADEVKADLLALNGGDRPDLGPSGELLDIIENVKNGDIATLASRVSERYWRKTSYRNTHTLLHINPVLRVVGTKHGAAGDITDTAYCGLVPFIDVLAPSGQAIALPGQDSVDDANIARIGEDTVEVTALMPLIDIDTLQIRINGVDLLAPKGRQRINLTGDDFPTTGLALCRDDETECEIDLPIRCGREAPTALRNIRLRNLRVDGLDSDLAPTVNQGVEHPRQVNVVTFRVSNLPPGGHRFRISADPLPATPLSANCYQDDSLDSGLVSAFGFFLDSPEANEVVADLGVDLVGVEGTACGAYPIERLTVNGNEVATDDQVCTNGDDVDQPAECYLPFTKDLSVASPRDLADGNASLTTRFRRGTNFVIARAEDEQGNSTVDRDRIFAFGEVQAPGYAELIERVKKDTDVRIRAAVAAAKAEIAAIDPAFIVALKPEAIQEKISQKCGEALETFSSRVSEALYAKDFGSENYEPPCSCDLHNVPYRATVGLVPHPNTPVNPACKVTFNEGRIDVHVHLPEVQLFIRAGPKSCTVRFLGMCVARTVVDVSIGINIKDIDFKYFITEEQLEGNADPEEDKFTFDFSIYDYSNRPKLLEEGYCASGPVANQDCRSNGFCNPDDQKGRCVGGPKDGKRCSESDDCADVAEYECIDDRCEGGPKDGDRCSTDRKCEDVLANYACEGVVDTDFKCVDTVENGAFDPIDAKHRTECLGAKICQVLLVATSVVLDSVTFGLFGGKDFRRAVFGDNIEFEVSEELFADLRASEPDPVDSDDLELDSNTVDSAGHAKLNYVPKTESAAATTKDDKPKKEKDVEITSQAMTLSIPAVMDSQRKDDPKEVRVSPGAPLTVARAPTPAEVAANPDLKDISLLIADDVFLQMFGSMKQSGFLKQGCQAEHKDGDPAEPLLVIGDLLPEDCDTLGEADKTASMVLQGICHAMRGVRGEDCKDLAADTDELTDVKVGSCAGFSSYNCEELSVPCSRPRCRGDDRARTLKQRAICRITPSRNILAESQLLFCAGESLEPEILVDKTKDGSTSKSVGAYLMFNDMDVSLVLDRSGNGYDGPRSELKSCFSDEGTVADDCLFVGMCIDVRLGAEMTLAASDSCPANVPGFAFHIDKPIIDFEAGLACTAASGADPDLIRSNALESAVVGGLSNSAEKSTPVMCLEGMDLGKAIDFDAPDLSFVRVTTDGTAGEGMADFIGLTIELKP